MMRGFVTLAALLYGVSVRADELPSWSVDGGPVYVLLGGQNATGGLGGAITGRYHLQLTDSIGLHPGLDLTAFGLRGDSHWWGVLTGPEAGLSWRGDHWSAAAAVGMEYGRVPVCNWKPAALWLRYWGIVPRAAVGVGYEVRPLGVVAGVAARYIDTLGWTGISWEPGLRARVSF